MPTLTVTNGEVPLHVIDHGGTGRPIVLLHGGDRSSEDWTEVAARLSALGYRPVAVDLRGHGRTPAAAWSWELVLSDVAAVADALALVRPAVVGHSLGGMIAALWAAEHPDCPLAVNLDGHGNPIHPSQYAGLAPEREAQEHAALRAALEDMGTRLDDYLRTVVHAFENLDRFAAYRRASGPLVVTRSTRSMADLLPEAVQETWRAHERWLGERLAALAADGAMELIATPTGHDVHLEDPTLVTKIVHERL
ncbi:alpha/beta fold hydrolase [Amycolatopsis sp. NPDC059021]|uniref:alpha/beta fold hydrolase n=1 Tax=Amycolatopsis sp. NPDC059021 TaxID=3346704 RepID=UPI003671B9FC